jgi:hypothetical protein
LSQLKILSIKKIAFFIVQIIRDHERQGIKTYNSRHLRKITKSKLNHKYVYLIKHLSLIIAGLFIIGSSCFITAPLMSLYFLDDISLNSVNYTYFTGSIFFTSASYLQYLQAINADITNKKYLTHEVKKWKWFAIRVHSLGFWATFVQFIGTLLFNLNTYSGTISSLSDNAVYDFITIPNMLGSLYFLTASFFAWLEVYHDKCMIQFKTVLWWIIWLNIFGSIFFQISAFYGLSSSSEAETMATYHTMFGAICFLIASYLLILEVKPKNKEQYA